MFEHPTGPRWAVCGENADQIDSRKYNRRCGEQRGSRRLLLRLMRFNPIRDTSCGTFVGSHRRFEALFRRGHCGVGSALTLDIPCDRKRAEWVRSSSSQRLHPRRCIFPSRSSPRVQPWSGPAAGSQHIAFRKFKLLGRSNDGVGLEFEPD
jgi:hypothetical protein